MKIKYFNLDRDVISRYHTAGSSSFEVFGVDILMEWEIIEGHVDAKIIAANNITFKPTDPDDGYAPRTYKKLVGYLNGEENFE